MGSRRVCLGWWRVNRDGGIASVARAGFERPMKPTLVTGANGHVGNNVCRLLRERGEPVRAMIRASADPAPLADLGVEIVHGDILDAAAVERAVDGCGRVYHLSLIHISEPTRLLSISYAVFCLKKKI